MRELWNTTLSWYTKFATMNRTIPAVRPSNRPIATTAKAARITHTASSGTRLCSLSDRLPMIGAAMITTDIESR